MSEENDSIGNNFAIADFAARSGASAGTIATYEKHLHQLEGWLGKPLARASERDLIALKKRLRDMASGVHYSHVLRMFYKMAKREDLRELMVIKQRAKRLSEQDILTVADVQAMVDVAGHPRNMALVAVLWETGVRIHELLAVDLRHVQVRDSPENGGRKIYVVWFGKTKVRGEEHTGYVIEAAPVLETWLKVHPDPRPDVALFTHWNGTRLGYEGAYAVVKKAAARAKIAKPVHPHSLRHARATHLLRLPKMKEITVKRLLGWKENSNMIARYAHLRHQDDYIALLQAQGLQPPEPMDLETLTFVDQDLQPIVPLNPPPGAKPAASSTPNVPTVDYHELAKVLLADRARIIQETGVDIPAPAWSAEVRKIGQLEKEIAELRARLEARP